MNWICNNIVNKKKWTIIPNKTDRSETVQRSHKGILKIYMFHVISPDFTYNRFSSPYRFKKKKQVCFYNFWHFYEDCAKLANIKTYFSPSKSIRHTLVILPSLKYIFLFPLLSSSLQTVCFLGGRKNWLCSYVVVCQLHKHQLSVSVMYVSWDF